MNKVYVVEEMIYELDASVDTAGAVSTNVIGVASSYEIAKRIVFAEIERYFMPIKDAMFKYEKEHQGLWLGVSEGDVREKVLLYVVQHRVDEYEGNTIREPEMEVDSRYSEPECCFLEEVEGDGVHDRLEAVRVKLDKDAIMPVRAHGVDAGADIFTPRRFKLEPGQQTAVRTGVHVEIPEGYAGILKSKSGLYIKHGITTTGVIDSGYSGEIVVGVKNNSTIPFSFSAGAKITQLVIVPVETPSFVQVDDIESGERGDSGFGSTGA